MRVYACAQIKYVIKYRRTSISWYGTLYSLFLLFMNIIRWSQKPHFSTHCEPPQKFNALFVESIFHPLSPSLPLSIYFFLLSLCCDYCFRIWSDALWFAYDLLCDSLALAASECNEDKSKGRERPYIQYLLLFVVVLYDVLHTVRHVVNKKCMRS